MANTALNRTVVSLLTNKSGGALNQGDVVVITTGTASSFTTTTTSGYVAGMQGVIIEPNGIANNASGLVATAGWVPKINLNTAASIGDFIKTHTVAGQGTPHNTPRVAGDFAHALSASSTPPAILFGMWMPTTDEVLNLIGASAQGDIIYKGASSWARLAAGTSGYFLQTQGAGANPTWAAAAGGGSGALTLVENKVVTTASTTLTFSTLDGDTDRSYLLIYNILAAGSGGIFEIRPNGVTTNLTETTYRSNGGGSAVDTPAAWYLGPSSVPASGYLTGFLNLKAAKSIHSVARTRTMSIQGISSANTREIFQGGGLWNESTTNLTSIDIVSQTALQIADGSNIALYKYAQA